MHQTSRPCICGSLVTDAERGFDLTLITKAFLPLDTVCAHVLPSSLHLIPILNLPQTAMGPWTRKLSRGPQLTEGFPLHVPANRWEINHDTMFWFREKQNSHRNDFPPKKFCSYFEHGPLYLWNLATTGDTLQIGFNSEVYSKREGVRPRWQI